MSKPTHIDQNSEANVPLDVNHPTDDAYIGEGARRIRETRQAIYSLFPIKPDDLDYEDTSNWWPAGSLTGGFDPAVENGSTPPHPNMQDRYALIGDKVAVWDWDMPDNKNILTIGLDTGAANITTPQDTNWVNIESDDKVEPMRLHDLMDVFLGTVEPEDDDVLVYNDAQSQWINRPRTSLVVDGEDGADGKGWTGTTVLQNDANTYIIRFNSTYPELVFDTENLKGTPGDDGLSAYEQWLAAGNSGTEQDFLDSFNGTDGVDGDSAYQIWLDAGNSGTEQDFLDSLVGPQGDGIHILGHIADSSQLPPSGNVGDAYLDDNGHLWIWENAQWIDAGQVQGPQGEVGPSITLVAGTATKLDHQAAPTVTLTDLGNDSYKYDFGIPAGTPADPVDLEPLENGIADLQTDLNSLEGRVAQNETDIADIQTEQITQNNAIQSNQDKNDEQDGRLDGLDVSVSDNATDISQNASDIADLTAEVRNHKEVPVAVKADDVLMSDGPDAYSWRTIDFAAIEDVRNKVDQHETTLNEPTTGLVDRVEDLETRLEGEDPHDHVTQAELDTALYGNGTSPSTADDGVYAAIQANTDLIEEINTNTIPALDGRVTQNETDIASLQTSTGNNASAISVLEGRVDGHDTDISQNQTDISTNAGNIAQNTTDIAQNTTDIGLLDGRVTVNEGNISTNTGNISTNASDISAIQQQLTPGSHETILTSVDNGDGTFSTTWAPNVHIDDELPDYTVANAGQILEVNQAGDDVEWVNYLNNSDPWTHGQWNEMVVADSGGTTSYKKVFDAGTNPIQKITVSGTTLEVILQPAGLNAPGIYSTVAIEVPETHVVDPVTISYANTVSTFKKDEAPAGETTHITLVMNPDNTFTAY